MTKRWIGVLALGTLFALSIGSVGAGPRRVFVEQLRGKYEVPAVVTPARGVATFVVSPDDSQIRFRVINMFLPNATAAHIHLGAEDENGPVVVQLYSQAPGFGTMHGTLATGIITAANLTGPLAGMPLSTLLNAMRSGNAYVNVHTDDGVGAQNTGPGDMASGEMRGQID